jgi:hypothetical protein
LPGQFAFPRDRWSKETRDAGKVGLFEVFRSWAGKQSCLVDRFHPETAGAWIAANPILVRGKKTYRLDEGSALTARTSATLRADVAEIVPVVVDFNVLARRADAVEPALHPSIASAMNSASRNSSAGPNASTCDYLRTGCIFCDSQACVAVKLKSTFIGSPAAAIGDYLEMNGVHWKAIGGDDSCPRQCFYQEAVKKTLHITKTALHSPGRALSISF